jgi:drug/metabolite transporter (DMT)-like permease
MTWAPLLAIGSALGFGVAGVLLRRALQYTGPVSAAVVSVSVTTAFIWAITALTTPLGRMLTWRIWPFLVAGLVAPGLARLFFFMGIDRIGVARAFSLMAGAPLFAVLLAIAFLGERPGPLLLAGAVAIVAGGVLLARRSHEEAPWRRRDMIFPLLGALGFAVRDNLSRWGFHEYGDALTAAAAATVTSLAMMWLVAGVRRTRLELPPVAFVFLVCSGLFEGLAYLLMWRALAIGDVSVVSPLVNAHSVVAIALAAIFLRDLEQVTWRIVVAAAVIVSGVALVMRGA